jgi:hypothetical protein
VDVQKIREALQIKAIPEDGFGDRESTGFVGAASVDDANILRKSSGAFTKAI